MLFSSLPFLYYFLPFTILLYLLAPERLKNVALLVCSLLFYAWGEPRYVLVMALSILLGYGFGLAIEHWRGHWQEKLAAWLSVGISLGLLGYFKYANFFLESFHAATGLSVPTLRVALPIGISFYTFQMISYTVDVYRGKVAAQRNLIHLAAYIAMFPQLIAGPIVRYADIATQLAHREHTLAGTAAGIRRFVLGLGKKVILANTLGELCDAFLHASNASVLYHWLYAISVTLYIYFDFSGYSDMAIGLGKLFGFDFPENFNYPLISKSATEFWRRWHMTLGSWFRDYLYIPLGGNRVKKSRWLLNLLIVWLATGLWHGAAWNFAVWGLFFAFFLILEKLWLKPLLEKSRVLSHVYLLVLVSVSFVIFNADTLGQAAGEIATMFGIGSAPLLCAEGVYQLKNYGVVLFLAVVGATPAVTRLFHKLETTRAGKILQVAEPIGLLALLLTATACLVNGSFNPFLYFRF